MGSLKYKSLGFIGIKRMWLGGEKGRSMES